MALFPDRDAANQRLLDLQRQVMAAQLARRQAQPKPHDWSFGFAGRPREFIGELIGPDWFGPEWLAWRTFISVVFAQPLESAGEWRMFQRCTGLSEPPATRPPSVWMPVGRRGGKSRMLAAIAVYLATAFDWSHYLDPGELGVLPVLAQDRRSAKTILNYIVAFLQHPNLAPLVEQENAESIRLQGNILIEVVTASFRAVRNRTVIAALLDELAFWRSDEGSANPDHEIIAALEPAMATIPNALLLGASSPYARRGVLWDQYERWFGKPGGPLVWQAPTRRMNPSVPQSFIDTQYQEDPLAAAAEYGAEFRLDADSFLSREVVDQAVLHGVHEIPPNSALSYYAFVDPSGGASDSMTLAIGHVEVRDGIRRGVLDVLRERRPPFSPESVVAEFTVVLREYRVSRVVGDHYAGEWPRERFRRSGIEYRTSTKSKSELYHEALPLLNANRVDLLDHQRMIQQLLQLERRVARGGHESIDHPPGSHDDVANVALGLMVNLLGRRDTLHVDASVLQRSAMIRTRPQFDPMPHGIGSGGPRW